MCAQVTRHQSRYKELEQIWQQLEAEIQSIRDLKVSPDCDPATHEDRLLSWQDRIEYELGFLAFDEPDD